MSPEGQYGDIHLAVKMALKSCSKGVFASLLGYGKSPCFFRCAFLNITDVDQAMLVFRVVDGGFFHV